MRRNLQLKKRDRMLFDEGHRKTAEELAREVLIPQLNAEREQQEKFEKWAKGDHPAPYKPDDASDDIKALYEKSTVPYIGLIIRILAQAIELQDYTPSDKDRKAEFWLPWAVNRMQTRQKRLYRAAFRGGLAYTVLTPGDTAPLARIFSAKNAISVYQDPEADEWPMYGMFVETASTKKKHFVLLDDRFEWRFAGNHDGAELEYIEHTPHEAGIAPIIRYSGETDDEGAVTGEVEALIPVQASIDQSKFEMLASESLSSWEIRYITGMAQPSTEEEGRKRRLILERNRLLLVENPDAKVGSLPGSNTTGHIEAMRSSKQELASLAQIAQKAILGSQANSSDGAEAQAAEEASTQRKLHDYETSFGESHAQFFRLAGHMSGIKGAFDDYAGVCDFRDSEIRSLSQMADALGKIATQLGVPQQALWSMLPNVSKERVDEWKTLLKEDPYGQLLGADGFGDAGAE